jgi:hypothetical protein
MPVDGTDIGALTDLRTTLAGAGFVNSSGRFEVDAITAGEGNGWKFSEDCLKESLPLWDGAACFVDHSFWGHSIRDMGGVFKAPRWCDETQGIRLELTTMGPMGSLVDELGRQILAGGIGQTRDEYSRQSAPTVGFSADISFSAKQRDVLHILKVHSLDLVFNPARGGAFVRALNGMLSIPRGCAAVHRFPGERHLGQEPDHSYRRGYQLGLAPALAA